MSAEAAAVNVIEVRGLTKRFDQLVAVDGIDLTVPKGQCLGLLGPNGAGKTTTMEMLEGLQEPSGGSIRLFGLEWKSSREALLARIGFQLQSTEFTDTYSVAETIRLFRSFYKKGLSVPEAVALVRLEEKQDARVNKLSGGQRQRLALAVALVSDPELVFLDEPTAGLDPQSRRALWDIILNLKSRGRTVILTTHYMDEAEELCDRVAIIDRGKILVEDSPDALIARLGGSHFVELTAVPPPPRAALEQVAGVTEVREKDGRSSIIVQELHATLPALLHVLQQNGCALQGLSIRNSTLDDVFLNLTGHTLRDDGA